MNVGKALNIAVPNEILCLQFAYFPFYEHQPDGLTNQLQEMVIDINREKTIKLYQPLIYLEDEIARIEVDAMGMGK